MTEATLTCPKCKNEIKLTDSLLEPLIASTRQKYDRALAEKDEDIVRKQAAINAQAEQLASERRTLDDQIAAKVEQQRLVIAADEARKAKLLLAGELKQREDEAETLKTILADRDQKLAEAQQAQ